MMPAPDAQPPGAEDQEARLRRTLQEAGFEGADELLGRLKALRPVAAAAADEAEPALLATEAVFRAAVSHTFTLGNVADGAAADHACGHIVPSGEAEMRALLKHSTTVMIGGRRRLMLRNAARSMVIHQGRQSSAFEAVLREAVRQDLKDFDAITEDPVRLPSAWLRSFLTGENGQLDRAPAREARAAVEALECLQGVSTAGPSLETARRLRDLAELLEPLRLLIGQRGGWEGHALTDRFVGRVDELARLREFVDELASHSALESATRLIGRGVRRAKALWGSQGESVLFIEARGGLGKSTLVAKFMLDHALSQTRPFPFAYLDFDRAAIRPRDALALLSEVARQVSLQHVDWQRDLAAFRSGLREEMAGGAASSGDPFTEFRDIVQTRITKGDRALLLVMDTMEVVQYDPMSIESIVNFQHRLAGDPSRDQLFPELRIVASGRADVPELRTRSQERSDRQRITLEPLGVAEARAMVDKLGQRLMKSDWRGAWSTSIAGRAQDPPGRREPLTLRVAVELLRDAKPDERPSLAREIARSGEDADEFFVGRLYERRILGHIRDPEVCRLAWPGLVFRRVTPALIRDLLAALCDVDPARADAVFRALSNEVWMVERVGPDTVRHRPDLRARTLPMMRRRTAVEGPSFEAVNDAAIRHYALRREEPADRAEWIYHRLLAGEDIAAIDADWTHELADHLRGAADDLVHNSPQRSYLLSRTATKMLPPSALAPLPTPLTLDYLARAGEQLGRFDDTRIHPVLLGLASHLSGPDADTTYPHPVRAVLLVKTGQWSVPAVFHAAADEWKAHADFAVHFVRARAPAGPHKAAPFQEVPSLRVCVQDLALARLTEREQFDELDRYVVEKIQGVRQSTAPADIAVLRTAVVFGKICSRDAARLWLNTHRDRLWRHIDPTLSLNELRALLGSDPAFHRTVHERVATDLKELGLDWGDLMEVVQSGADLPLSMSHPTLVRMVGDILASLLDDSSEEALRQVRAYFAARDEDWIVPMAYSLARTSALRDRGQRVAERLASYGAGLERKQLLDVFKTLPRPPRDAIRLLRQADQASDLGGMAHLFRVTAHIDTAYSDLQLLLDRYGGWRAAIARILGGQDRHESASSNSVEVIVQGEAQHDEPNVDILATLLGSTWSSRIRNR